jgi:hypothetical protein
MRFRDTILLLTPTDIANHLGEWNRMVVLPRPG